MFVTGTKVTHQSSRIIYNSLSHKSHVSVSNSGGLVLKSQTSARSPAVHRLFIRSLHGTS
jgi:hypothetical protein